MGYTHYWTQTRTLTDEEWTYLTDAAKAIVKDVQHVQGIGLAFEYDEPTRQPQIDNDFIRFNGLGENGHETFMLTRRRRVGSTFCKTAEKGYDLAVTAILAVAATCLDTPAFHVTSDGSVDDWVANVEEARRAYPPCANMVDIPMPIMQAEVWRSGRGTGFYLEAPYIVHEAIDGHFYVVRLRDKAVCRLDDEAHFDRIALEIRRIYESYANGGWVNAARRASISRAQSRKLNKLVETAGMFDRDHRPPAYVRPGRIPVPAVSLPESIFA